MKLTLKQIADAVHGQLIGEAIDITGVSIDTRTLKQGNLYIALRGKNFDGHQFIVNAEQCGAAALIVERLVDTVLPQILVANSRLALAELAGFWRQQCQLKVVGVTGSNGKTTVKEMIAAILSTQGETLFTKGNLNNDIGVPLTLLEIDEKHQFAVIEMGANHPGEIAYSSRYVQADVVVITNAGAAHIEGFGSLDGIARSKGEIVIGLKEDGIAVLNADDVYFPLWLAMASKRRIASFGLTQQAQVTANNSVSEFGAKGFETRFQLQSDKGEIDIQLQLAGEHNVKNALAAAAVAMQFNIDLISIKQGLAQLKPVLGRMQALKGSQGNLVIDDTYNANPSSLAVALQALKQDDENWLILGAFGELGGDSAEIHYKMGEMIKSSSVKKLFAVGEMAKQTVIAFGQGGQFFHSQAQLITALTENITGRETLLVKGSRSQKMENVVAALVDDFRAA